MGWTAISLNLSNEEEDGSQPTALLTLRHGRSKKCRVRKVDVVLTTNSRSAIEAKPRRMCAVRRRGDGERNQRRAISHDSTTSSSAASSVCCCRMVRREWRRRARQRTVGASSAADDGRASCWLVVYSARAGRAPRGEKQRCYHLYFT